MRISDSERPVTNQELDEFERMFDLALPKQYRAFLLRNNGGAPERDAVDVPACVTSPRVGVFYFFAVHAKDDAADLAWNYRHRWKGIGPNVLPIASTAGAYEFCLDLQSGRVLLHDPYLDEPELHDVAPDFDTFVDRLQRDEDSPPWDDK
jgi:hypothetical protein